MEGYTSDIPVNVAEESGGVGEVSNRAESGASGDTGDSTGWLGDSCRSFRSY